MLFFFKEKPVTITAFLPSNMQYAADYSPIAESRKFIPQWWKDIRSSEFNWEIFERISTIKSCTGIVNSLLAGYMIPMWCDLALKNTWHGYKWVFADPSHDIHHHAAGQSNGFFDDFHHLKMTSPWILQSKVKILTIQPQYYFKQSPPWFTPSGILSPMNSYSSTNIFIFVKKIMEGQPDQEILFKKGVPMSQLIPLTDKKTELKIEVVTAEEYKKIGSSFGTAQYLTGHGLKLIHEDQKKLRNG